MGVSTNFCSEWGQFSSAQEVDKIVRMTDDEIGELYQLYKEYRKNISISWDLKALQLIYHINWLFSGNNLEFRTIGADVKILRKFCGRLGEDSVENLRYVTFAKPLWDEQVRQLYELLKTYIFFVRADPTKISDEELIVNTIGIIVQDIIVKAKIILEKLARGIGVYQNRMWFNKMIFKMLDFIDRKFSGPMEEKFMGLERNFFVFVEIIRKIRNMAIHDSAREFSLKTEWENWNIPQTKKTFEKRVILVHLDLKEQVNKDFHQIPEKYKRFPDIYGPTFFKHVDSKSIGFVTINEYIDRLDETSTTVFADLHRFIAGVESVVDFLFSHITWSLKHEITNDYTESRCE